MRDELYICRGSRMRTVDVLALLKEKLIEFL